MPHLVFTKPQPPAPTDHSSEFIKVQLLRTDPQPVCRANTIHLYHCLPDIKLTYQGFSGCGRDFNLADIIKKHRLGTDIAAKLGHTDVFNLSPAAIAFEVLEKIDEYIKMEPSGHSM